MRFLLAFSLCILAQEESFFIPKEKTPPEGRAGIVLVYIPLISSLVLFGGHANDFYFNDLWGFDIKNLLWDEIQTNSESIPCNF